MTHPIIETHDVLAIITSAMTARRLALKAARARRIESRKRDAEKRDNWSEATFRAGAL